MFLRTFCLQAQKGENLHTVFLTCAKTRIFKIFFIIYLVSISPIVGKIKPGKKKKTPETLSLSFRSPESFEL